MILSNIIQNKILGFVSTKNYNSPEGIVINIDKSISLSLLAIVFFLIGTASIYSGVFDGLDRMILDYKFRYLQQEDPNEKIVLVTIDEKSLSYFNQNGMYWPWPREFYQIVTDYFNQSDARLVVYDILFDTPDFDRRNISGTMSDQRFLASIEKSNNIVLAFKSTAHKDSSVDLSINNEPLIDDYNINNDPPYEEPHLLTSKPLDEFADAAEALGNTVMSPDEDGLIRSVHLFDSLAYKGFVPTLSMAAYLELKPDSISLNWTDRGLQVGDTEIPLQENGDYLINWYKKGGVEDGTFPYYSFQAIVKSAIQKQRNPEAEVPVPPSVFEDKIVLLGASAAGLGDIKSTPMSSLEAFPGMEIQATLLNNLIGNNFITQPPSWLTIMLLLLLSVTIPFIIAYTRPTNGGIAIIGILSLIVLAGLSLFMYDRIWFSTGLYFVFAAITYTGSATYKYFSEEKQKKEIRSAFGQYVQPEFVEQLIAQPDLLKLGGQKKRLTVLFSDIAGFTTISEQKEPEDLVSFLNKYLGAMTDIIFAHSGTVDKYIGDAVMAFWGAPIGQENHAELACRSAIKMMNKVEELAPQETNISSRFGIATGDMIVGNIGSYNRFNYTVLGDTVNLAARLEAANKKFGSSTMIAEHTYHDVKDKFYCRQLDFLVVKGKTEPVRVYELMGEKSETNNEQLEEIISIYQQGLDFYLQKEWDKAIETFNRVLSRKPNDGPSKTYIERCQQFKQNPPAEDWDGVFHLKSK